MGAIHAFITEMYLQLDLLDDAINRDAIAINRLKYGVACEPGERLEWTRRDKNRLAWLSWLRSQDGVNDDLWRITMHAHSFGRTTTRTSVLLRMFGRVSLEFTGSERHSITRFRGAAIREAESRGIYTLVAPLIIEAANRHSELIDAYTELDEFGQYASFIGDWPVFEWDDLRENLRLAVRRIREYCPLDEAERIVATYLGEGRVKIGDRVEQVGQNQSRVALEYLVRNSPSTTEELRTKGKVSNPSEAISNLREFKDGFLAEVVHMPQGRGAGYATSIVDGRKTILTI